MYSVNLPFYSIHNPRTHKYPVELKLHLVPTDTATRLSHNIRTAHANGPRVLARIHFHFLGKTCFHYRTTHAFYKLRLLSKATNSRLLK